MRLLALLAVLLLVPAAVEAQEAPEGDVDVPAGEDRIAVAREGVPAPFTGQLFDQATALRWGNRIVRYRMRIHLLEEELRETRSEYEASTARQIRIMEESSEAQLRLQRESFEREILGLRTDLRDQAARYEAELAQHRNPPFYEEWGFAFGMGVLVTGVVVGIVGGLIAGL